MSTILDALKKSEEERKVTKVPTLADMQAPQEPSKWSNVLLLIIVLLLFVLLALAIKFILYSPVKGLERPQAAIVEEVSESLDSVESASNTEDEQVEPLTEIDDSEIEVHVVSYSELAEKRFIMINGKLFRENEFVRAGLKVEEIRQNEVIFNQRGEQIIRRP